MTIDQAGSITVGVDDTGYDVKFFGATTGKYMLWDEDQNKLTVSGDLTVTGTVAGVTATHVGLSSVDNTADADKPISTATQTALNLKAPIAADVLTKNTHLHTRLLRVHLSLILSTFVAFFFNDNQTPQICVKGGLLASALDSVELEFG